MKGGKIKVARHQRLVSDPQRPTSPRPQQKPRDGDVPLRCRHREKLSNPATKPAEHTSNNVKVIETIFNKRKLSKSVVSEPSQARREALPEVVWG